MSRRKKHLEIILRQHISTYDDNNLSLLEMIDWFSPKVKLRQWFKPWYDNNNKGSWWN